ncbi:MAG: UDP binding domain-containing protein, partial [Pirellula sp.]
RILLVGLAYKAEVDDARESPGYTLMDKLKERGAELAYYDPYIPVIRPSREHGHWAGMECVPWSEAEIRKYDAVLIATAHKAIDYLELSQWAGLIVDTRNAMHGIAGAAEIVKA